ncbi:unnamed protein product [Chrysodeixis includens]|uniref:Uncharacterized protein n=1 Tax=Chrysodeixis includens TaxID=689277 RepID=A0A9N8KYC4_CHRIL|nr:unnamed protein product [Chrysodeixis includens]
MEFQNVTLRRNKTTANESLNLSSISTTSDYLAKSLPDLSTGQLFNEDIERYKDEIEKLKEELAIAHNEIDNLTIEKNNLQLQFYEQKQKNEQLKQICTNSPSTLKKTKSKQKASKKLQQRTSNLNMSCNDLDLIPDNNVDLSTIDVANSKLQLKASEMQNSPRYSEMSHEDTKQKTLEIPRNCSFQQNIVQEEQLSSSQLVPTNISFQSVITRQGAQRKTLTNSLIKKRVFIFGGQSCSGLTKHLITSRHDNPYTKYQFISIIKSHASTEEILNSAKLFEITENDRIVLFIGQNDSNPFKVKAELCYFLKCILCPVFVLRVFRNKHINEFKLNNMLRMICKQFSGCTYVNVDYKNSYNIFRDLCYNINYALDQTDYDLTFLTATNKILHRVHTDKIIHTKSKKLTNEQSTQTDTAVNTTPQDFPLNNNLFRI